MELRTKIAQMVMLGFRGTKVREGEGVAAAVEQGLGSVVLFDWDVLSKTAGRNIQSPQQLQELVADLQRFAKVPLLVAVDQEGGKVRRLKEELGFPPLPSAAVIGRRDELAFTHNCARRTAAKLAQLGINLNLAPCVDLNLNPQNPVIGGLERSFSAEVDKVVAHARVFIEAHHNAGVGCTLKHFPGHGSSTADSHLGLTDVTHTWVEAELDPYRILIEAGLVDGVMSGHVFNASLDPQLPATLSKAVIDGLLRRRLGFDGVVVSDDMQMGAIANHYGFEKALQLAILAGVDLIALANNTLYEEGIFKRTVDLVEGMVHRGAIGEERIEQSFKRIKRLKDLLRDRRGETHGPD